jgi:hypothetical protein
MALPVVVAEEEIADKLVVILKKLIHDSAVTFYWPTQ